MRSLESAWPLRRLCWHVWSRSSFAVGIHIAVGSWGLSRSDCSCQAPKLIWGDIKYAGTWVTVPWTTRAQRESPGLVCKGSKYSLMFDRLECAKSVLCTFEARKQSLSPSWAFELKGSGLETFTLKPCRKSSMRSPSHHCFYAFAPIWCKGCWSSKRFSGVSVAASVHVFGPAAVVVVVFAVEKPK